MSYQTASRIRARRHIVMTKQWRHEAVAMVDLRPGGSQAMLSFGTPRAFSRQLRKYDSDVIYRNLCVCDAARMNTEVNRQADRVARRQTNP